MGLLDKFKEGLQQGVKEEKEKQDQEKAEREARKWLAKKEAQEKPSELGKTVGRTIQKIGPAIKPVGDTVVRSAGLVAGKTKVAVENYAKNQAKAIKSGKAKDPFIVKAPPGAGLDNMLAGPRMGGIGGGLDGILGLPAVARPPRTDNLSRGVKKKRDRRLRNKGISNQQRGWRPGEF